MSKLLEPFRDDVVDCAQRLIQTPSYPGQEGAVAEVVRREMGQLGYEVATDRVGNVVGLVRGLTSSRSILFNAHMDHVSVGDEKAWRYPPFAGTVADGALWGRGAVDLKGSLAAMIYGIGALRQKGYTPPCDVYVAAVVFEETGGVGTQVLLEQLHPEFCVIGEASNNQLSLGHRGLAGMVVDIGGRAVHASMADLGVNPHYSAARFLLGLRELGHVSDPMLGPSTVAPTLYSTDQVSHNVVPGRVQLYLDWRSVPGETPAGIMANVRELLARSLEPGATGDVHPRTFNNRTYTGIDFVSAVAKAAVKLDPDSELARRSHAALEAALRRPVRKMVWRFCTDGAVCAEAGVPIVGFGPGDEELAHTSDEHIELDALREAMVGNAALALSAVTPLATS